MSALAGVVLLVAATLFVGLRGVRVARTTSEFLVASRSVSPRRNAMAIAGEYLSAASFLGVAGLVLKDGIGALWYPVGFTAGYVSLLALVAAPLRRLGAYTVPDFAEGRLESLTLRRLTAWVVIVIAWLYLVPQLKGAGAVLGAVAGTPYWVGVVLAGTVVAATLASGGMRAVTYVQALLYLVKLAFIAIPAVVLVVAAGSAQRSAAVSAGEGTVFPRTTTVQVPGEVRLAVGEPVTVTAAGRVDGIAVDGPLPLVTGPHVVGRGTSLTFPAGAQVPRPAALSQLGGQRWASPLVHLSAAGHPLFETYSVLLATLLGTMGLPHVLVRFSTNPDGRRARRTAVVTIALLGAFYLFPGVYGVLGRVATPELHLAGTTDTVVVTLPAQLLAGTGAPLVRALVVTGAFAAFLSTSSGLLLSLASAVSHDLTRSGVRGLRKAAAGAALVAVLLALPSAHLDIGVLVGWAFAVAASTLCPLLVLGIWWPRLTAPGAAAGLVCGAALSTGAVLVTVLVPPGAGWLATLLAQPAGWSVPLAFVAMVLGSLTTRSQVPVGTTSALARMHLMLEDELADDEPAVEKETGVAGPRWWAPAPPAPGVQAGADHRRPRLSHLRADRVE